MRLGAVWLRADGTAGKQFRLQLRRVPLVAPSALTALATVQPRDLPGRPVQVIPLPQLRLKAVIPMCNTFGRSGAITERSRTRFRRQQTPLTRLPSQRNTT